jgi:hypothetical protein
MLHRARQAIAGQIAIGNEGCRRVHVGGRESLRSSAGDGSHAKRLEIFSPRGARLEPPEVDPSSVRRPAHILRWAADQLRPAHDVPDGEFE